MLVIIVTIYNKLKSQAIQFSFIYTFVEHTVVYQSNMFGGQTLRDETTNQPGGPGAPRSPWKIFGFLKLRNTISHLMTV